MSERVLWQGEVDGMPRRVVADQEVTTRPGEVEVMDVAEEPTPDSSTGWVATRGYHVHRIAGAIARELAARDERERALGEAVARLVSATARLLASNTTSRYPAPDTCGRCGRLVGQCQDTCEAGAVRAALAHPALKVGK